MRRGFLVAVCLLAAAPANTAAQQGGSAGCYIQVPKLVAAAPSGIDELGVAIRALDDALRPQVEEVNRLKAALERMQAEDRPPLETDENGDPVERAQIPDGRMEEERRLSAELVAKQDQLKRDYVARQAEIVGPVQARIGQRAKSYGSSRGCSQMKMARSADLPALQSAGAQDITTEFVAWYPGGGAT